MENPIKMDDLGVSLFLETPYIPLALYILPHFSPLVIRKFQGLQRCLGRAVVVREGATISLSGGV